MLVGNRNIGYNSGTIPSLSVYYTRAHTHTPVSSVQVLKAHPMLGDLLHLVYTVFVPLPLQMTPEDDVDGVTFNVVNSLVE